MLRLPIAILLMLATAAPAIARDEPAIRIPPADIVKRRELLAQRKGAEQAGDLTRVATINARLNAEALDRAVAAHDAWMTRRYPESGLFPRSPQDLEWTYRDTGADFFGFQYIIAFDTGAASLPKIRETFARERELNEPHALCDSLDCATGHRLPTIPHERMFGTCEYLKDGLTSLYDRTGDQPVLDRMIELSDAVIAASEVKSNFGPIPSHESEINGNVLQTFSRLGFMTGQDRYFDAMGHLADAVIGQMLASPACNGLPVKAFDYPNDRPRPKASIVQLRDHGNETAVGISEAFAAAVALSAKPEWKERAARWADPVAGMYEKILTRGINSEGMIVNRLDARTLEPIDNGPADNWGYLLAGAILFTEAAGKQGTLPKARIDAIFDGIDRASLAVTKTDGLVWEGPPEHPHHDGFADTIESALYVASRRTGIRAPLLAWADDQTAYLDKCQSTDGFVSGDYLDGNFIRTEIMYADMRSGGFQLRPRQPGSGVGLAALAGKEPVIVVMAGPAGCHSRLIPDTDRHRHRMHLPWDWSRINSWPEWAGVELGPDGKAAPAGIQIDLGPSESKTIRLSETGASLWCLP